MKYITIKIATVKVIAICVGLCVLFAALLLTGTFGMVGTALVSGQADTGADLSVNENRLQFLQQLGWEAEAQPIMEKEVLIPQNFDAVYTKYNDEVEKPSGYDLSKYAGKNVQLYSYHIVNYPTDDYVYANLLIYKNRVIGGDICSAALDGFMHGLTPPDGVLSPTGAQLED